MNLRPKALLTCAALAIAASSLAAQPREARATGSAAGELGASGTVTGDISTEPGEQDTAGIDLVQGSTLGLKLAASFSARVGLRDPSGTAVPLTFTGTSVRTASAPVAATGRHVLTISSADESQGRYTLSASCAWPKSLSLPGTSGGRIEVSLPAGAKLKGFVAAEPAGSWDPQIVGIWTPAGAQTLPAPVAGRSGAAKLPKFPVAAAGVHGIEVGGGVAGAACRAEIKIKVPRLRPARLDLTNGLTVVGFAAGGVGKMLQDRCGACHPWVASAAAAKPHAKPALSRVLAGNMPQGGPRLPDAEVALLRAWIDTGLNP